MIDFSSLRGEMLPWYYKNAKLHNNELVAVSWGQVFILDSFLSQYRFRRGGSQTTPIPWCLCQE